MSSPDRAAGIATPRLVLVHGTRDLGSSFAPVAKLLAPLDVVYYDRRGWAVDAKPLPNPPATLDHHVDDALAALGRAGGIIVGHSWGGHVAIAAAISRPDLVHAIGIYETALTWTPWWPEGHAELIRQAAERARLKTDGTPRQRRERALFVHEALETLTEVYSLDDLTVPAVAGYGEHSMHHFREGIETFAKITDSELEIVESAAHMAHRENPEGFAEIARRAVAASSSHSTRRPITAEPQANETAAT